MAVLRGRFFIRNDRVGSSSDLRGGFGVRSILPTPTDIRCASTRIRN